VRRWPRVRPYPAPRRRRAPFRPYPRRASGELKPALFWAAAFVVLGGGYGVLAPVVDDTRSSLRPMAATCRIASVLDGDTVELACADRGALRARIVGYDSPELFSPRCRAEAEAADRARRALQGFVDRTWRVEVAFLGQDRYDRELVDMRLDGVRVAPAMVEAGYGRRYFGAARGGWC
jgi:micrococcal nuclease